MYRPGVMVFKLRESKVGKREKSRKRSGVEERGKRGGGEVEERRRRGGGEKEERWSREGGKVERRRGGGG